MTEYLYSVFVEIKKCYPFQCTVSSRIVGSGVNSLQNHNAVGFANNDKEVEDLLKVSLQRLVEKKPPNVILDLKDVREKKMPDLFAKHCQTTLTDAQIEDVVESAQKELKPDKVEKLTRIMLQLAHGSIKEKKIAFVSSEKKGRLFFLFHFQNKI